MKSWLAGFYLPKVMCIFLSYFEDFKLENRIWVSHNSGSRIRNMQWSFDGTIIGCVIRVFIFSHKIQSLPQIKIRKYPVFYLDNFKDGVSALKNKPTWCAVITLAQICSRARVWGICGLVKLQSRRLNICTDTQRSFPSLHICARKGTIILGTPCRLPMLISCAKCTSYCNRIIGSAYLHKVATWMMNSCCILCRCRTSIPTRIM